MKKDVTSPEAFEYIINQLSLGAKHLSNFVSQLSIRKGRVFSFFPQELPDDLIYKFESGGLTGITITNNPQLVPIQNHSLDVLTNIICEYLNVDDNNCCILEEPNAKPSDAWVSKSTIKYVHLNDEMYYFLDISNSQKSAVEKILKISEAYYFLCVLSKLKVDLHPKTKSISEINSELIELLVANLSRFFVKAYDGESYLMWER